MHESYSSECTSIRLSACMPAGILSSPPSSVCVPPTRRRRPGTGTPHPRCVSTAALAAIHGYKENAMQDRDGFIWLDGQWLPWREAKVHALTHTLHYGYGCFEGIRAYETAKGPAIFRIAEHLRRLQDSAHILAIDLPYDYETLAVACREAISRNGLRSAYIRPLVFLGAEKLGVDPAGAETHVMVAAWPWGAYLGGQAIEKGIRVRVSSYARHHPNVQMCRAKAISTYSNSILAVREARRDGYDEALLLDTAGLVAEGSGENLFLVRDGRLYEPQTTSALDGITRRTIHALAEAQGLTVTA